MESKKRKMKRRKEEKKKNRTKHHAPISSLTSHMAGLGESARQGGTYRNPHLLDTTEMPCLGAMLRDYCLSVAIVSNIVVAASQLLVE